MVDSEKFTENVKTLLSEGAEGKDVVAFIKRLGFSEQEAKAFVAEAGKGQIVKTETLMRGLPTSGKQQQKQLSPQKEEEMRRAFRENMEEVAKIVERLRVDRKEPVQ